MKAAFRATKPNLIDFIRPACIASLLGVFFLLSTGFAYAQVDVAVTYPIALSEEAQSGDIISFRKDGQRFERSAAVSDAEIFGIIAEDPLLVLEMEGANAPIVRTGEARVNVVSSGGAIAAGDVITSSTVPGKGQRAREEDRYVVGTALEPFPSSGSPEELTGSIRVLLSIGDRMEGGGGAGSGGFFGGIGGGRVGGGSGSGAGGGGGSEPVSALKIIQFVLAAFIGVGSIYFAFRHFGQNLKEGITSVGRNPLAKAPIRSMVVTNAALILLICALGLFASIAVFLIPI